MGWASGSYLAQKVWDLFVETRGYSEISKRLFAKELVDIFESEDCDTMDECEFVQKYLVYNEHIQLGNKKYPLTFS